MSLSQTPSSSADCKGRACQRTFALDSKSQGATTTGNIYCKSQIFKGKITLRTDASKLSLTKVLKCNTLASYGFLLDSQNVQRIRLENLFKPNSDTKTNTGEKRFNFGGLDGCEALR